MAVASATSPLPSRRSLQFSLGGMLLTFCLVFSIGLAYSRLNDVTFCSAMLLSFSIWLAMGLMQDIRSKWRRPGDWSELPRERRWGHVLQWMVPLWSLLLLAIAAVSEVQRRYGWSSWLQGEFAYLLFFLAIISAYWYPRTAACSPPKPLGVVRTVFSAALLAVLAAWTVRIVATQASMFRLIYTAIRNVERTQPTTFAGRPFTPQKLTLSGDLLLQIFGQLTIASGLMIIAVAISLLMLCAARVRWLKLVLFTVWVLSLGAAIACLFACWSIGTTEISPIRYASVYSVGVTDAVLLSVLMGTFLTALGLHFAATNHATSVSDFDVVAPLRTPLHKGAGVIGFGLCAVSGQLLETLLEKGSNMNSVVPAGSWIFDANIAWPTLRTLCHDFAFYMPFSMIHVAAALVLARSLWRTRRGLLAPTGVWSVEPNKFAAAWLLSLVTLVVAMPIAVWRGVVATLLN